MVRVQPNTPATGNTSTRAAVRAAQRRRRTLILVAIIVVLAIAFAVVLAIFFTRGGGSSPEQEVPSTGECLPASLRITTDPALEGAIEAIIADMTEGDPDDCPAVTVRVEDSSITAAALGSGTAPDFDVWVPDSAMWPARAAGVAELMGVDAPELIVSDPVASTPVVFAATEPTAAALGSEAAGFASLAGRKVAAVLPDPSAVASSSAALLALQTAVGGDARAFTALVLGLDTGVVPTSDEALAAASAATSPTIAVTTEQAVLEYDDTATPLVPIYPADVKPSVGIPVVSVADTADETGEAVAAFTTAMANGGDRLAEFGLRDAAGNAADPATAEAAAAPEPSDSTNQAEALRTWQVLTAPSRMLSLNDVSGSMLEPVTADMRRIDLFEQAAVRAINSLSADSSLATWVFSSRRIGGQDWQEVVPFGPLGDAAHKQRTIDTANGLDSLVGGGTGLYDSVLAAVKYMRETYVPGQINLVLLNTDGFNEDDDGLELSELLTELEALHDPAKPVAVIAIGYGPDTDLAALEQIAAATDGAAYQAVQPTDIGTVLIDAVTQRGCRPNCG